MPLWLVYHPEGIFTSDAKAALAADITSIYTAVGLPAFYVIVNFISLPNSSIHVGGKSPSLEKPFIRFSVDHIAVHTEGDVKWQARIAARIETKLKPHIADKGYDWEFHVDETPRELWRVNGFVPPPHKSEAERLWAEKNKAVEWQNPKGKL
ncbi:putative oxalocrotonate tautomerase [Lasiosphaeris hirsuta]|uniref:Oxalocrotonate tautomerase n=1 Tax=Lasiosphaeris hirsuta TaxID=260670 RepID=A0AA40DSN0_9PEZI|nr:putative oxalocrotonate tautomerase [Lasiosphaeris hirsuta]